MKILRLIPNTLTLGNAFCGVLGIIYAMNGQLAYAALFIYVATILDFLDGFAARMLHIKSAIGGQLDSLSDAVTFGVLPSIIFYKLLQSAYSNGMEALDVDMIYLLPALAIAMCAIYRLALFNIDTRQKESFVGLPTPAMAMFTAALPFYSYMPMASLEALPLNTYFLYGCIIFFSYIMVSPLRMLSLKFSNFSFSGVNMWRYMLIIIGIVAVVFLKFAAAGVIILLYIILSVIQHLTTTKTSA